MKKVQQTQINNTALELFNNAIKEFNSTRFITINAKKLRSCSAIVMETHNYYILQSYNTIVAVIEKSTDTLVDVLRYVYGYTATSGQHISKFNHDYCKGYGCCQNTLRYYHV